MPRLPSAPSPQKHHTQVSTLKAPGETLREVAVQGEFEGEDLPLYSFELRRRGVPFWKRLLQPNTAAPEVRALRARCAPLRFARALGWGQGRRACVAGGQGVAPSSGDPKSLASLLRPEPVFSQPHHADDAKTAERAAGGRAAQAAPRL